MHFPFCLHPTFMLKENKVVVAITQAFEPRKRAHPAPLAAGSASES
jgi:hypothetical protein